MRTSVAIIQGTVSTLEGQPVAHARVVITTSPVPMPEIAAVTDIAGQFSFAVPVPGEYSFAAYSSEAAASPAKGSVYVETLMHRIAEALPPSADPNAEVSSEDSIAPAPAQVEVTLPMFSVEVKFRSSKGQ